MKKFVLLFIGLSGYSVLVTMEKPQQQKHGYFIVDQPRGVSYNPEIVDNFSELCGIAIPEATPLVSVKISEKIPSFKKKKPLLVLIEKYGIPIVILYKKEFILHDKDYKYQFHFERGPDLTDDELQAREQEFMIVPLITVPSHWEHNPNKFDAEMSFGPDTIKLIKQLVAKNILKKIENSSSVPHLQYEHGKQGWLELKQKIVKDFYNSDRLNSLCNNESATKIEHLLLYKRH